MWSDWYCGFHSVCPVMEKVRDLWKLPDGRDWLRGKLALFLMRWAMLSKSLIQFSIDGWGCVPSLLFDLRPNYGGGNEDNGDLQKVPYMYCYTQCPQPCSRPPWIHGSAGDSWKFPGKSGSVSCGGHCSFLLGPGAHKFLCVPSKSLLPQSCVSSGSSMVGLMATSSKRAYAIPRSAALRAPAPVAVHCWSIPRQEMLKHSSFSASVMSLGPGVHKSCLSAWASLAGMGFDSKHEFAPPTVLLGFILCPWTWDISSKKFQCCTATAPAPTVFLWLLWPCWGTQ